MSKAQAIPEDAETYVVRAKEAHAPAGKAMKELEDITEAQLSRAVKTLKIEEVNQALEDARRRRSGASAQQAETLAHQLFKDKTPDQIKQIIAGLTPEMIQNLQMLAQATDPVAMAMAQRQAQPVQPQKSETETLITMLRLWKEMQPPAQQQQNALTLEGVAALIKAFQQPQQNNSSPMEVVKLAGELNRPVIDMMKATTDLSKGKDKEIFDLKMKDLENKMPQDPVETIKYVKEMSGVLGLGNAKSEVDLKLAEMRQHENIDMKRLDWEQKKYELEAESDNAKWEQITKILQGPIGQAISNVGSAGADRVRGRPNVGQPRAVQTNCPSCNKVIWVDALADTAICGSCGAQLSKSGANPEPVAPMPPPQPPPEPEPQPQQVNSPATSEDQQTEEEEEILESDETETEIETEQ